MKENKNRCEFWEQTGVYWGACNLGKNLVPGIARCSKRVSFNKYDCTFYKSILLSIQILSDLGGEK